ncbi:hypothetical protein B0J14DRAFT_560185 [Halenospora varia]|nr:hypothetical protein B0J14DRAFT_560185 [Halenospora varia]
MSQQPGQRPSDDDRFRGGFPPTSQGSQHIYGNYFNNVISNTDHLNQGNSFSGNSSQHQYNNPLQYFPGSPLSSNSSADTRSSGGPYTPSPSWTESTVDYRHDVAGLPGNQANYSNRNDASPGTNQSGNWGQGGMAAPSSSQLLRSLAIHPTVNIRIFCANFQDEPENVIATKDTGTRENWISSNVVYRCGLVPRKGLPQIYETFDGTVLESGEVVNPSWFRQGTGQSQKTEFRVVLDPPFDVLFGRNFLAHSSHLLDDTPDPVQPLVQRKIKSAEQKQIGEDRAKADAESAQIQSSYTRGESSRSKDSSKKRKHNSSNSKGSRKE